MKNMKKILAILLLLTMLFTVAACKKNGNGDESANNSGSANDVEDSGDDFYLDRFGDLDLAGKEIWIFDLNTSPDAHVNHYHDVQGDEIDVELCKRDMMLETLYGVSFEYFNSTAGSKHLSNPILSGTYVADIVYGRASGDRLMALTQGGCLMDMCSLPSLSFNEQWWSKFMCESLTVNGKMYFTSGDILPTFYQSVGSFYFNINLGEEYGINKDELAAAVFDGKWTWEKLKTLSANATSNLDSNQELTADADQFGFISYNVYNHTNMFAIGAGLKLCEQTEDGTWTIDLTSGTREAKLAKLQSYMDNYSMGSGGVDSIMETTFKSGRAIFAEHFIESAFNTLTDMEDDYIMLPVPMIDEDQGEYYCMVNSYVNCFVGITSNCSDSEVTSAILESMAYAGYNDIRPVVYERVLKTRLSRDAVATQLIDLVFDSAYIDYGVIEKFGVTDDYKQGVSTVLYNYLKEGESLTSALASIQSQVESELQNTVSIFMK